MEEMLVIVFSLTAIMCLILGWLIKYRKYYGLISGYKGLSESDKDQIDHEALGNFSGGILLILGIVFLLGAMLELLKLEVYLSILMVLIVPLVIYVYYRSNQFGLISPLGNSIKPLMFVIFLILITSTAFNLERVFYSGSTGKVEVGNSAVLIRGMYGTTISFDRIKEVRLAESIPSISHRTFGYSLGEVRRGNFKLEEIGAGKLFLETNQGPYVYLITDESFIIINFKDETKTRALYEKIIDSGKVLH
ncbi:uncharacterized protein DUF3784 [Desulfitobacterium sp. LBE]|uniref:DUF3784 domain-containing protein n=1 Tax=Desulfitobacterium sp. LBE TaxID=884086 RepID=UPI0011994156|nr:DUF3784 domain-containing protein [Desulfitobacterium sp. LBE]TWH60520.1 uncharacterized protein DUF3784 [Desulfitobacterium sp. LBE]